MTKYVWQKKKEYFSEVETYSSRFLYDYGDIMIMISFSTKEYNEHIGDYIHDRDDFYKYLFTEEEVKEKLPNSYHMFEPVVMKIDTDSVYGEIERTEIERTEVE